MLPGQLKEEWHFYTLKMISGFDFLVYSEFPMQKSNLLYLQNAP